MRGPLFGSSPRDPAPPALRWRIPKHSELVGQRVALAGLPIALHTHRVGKRTLPCLRDLPALGIECPHCERSRGRKCWCPVVPVDIPLTPRPLWIVMGATTLEDSVKQVRRGELCQAGRALTLKPTWVLKLLPDQSEQALGLGILSRDVPERGDITRWLLHYWQWPLLAEKFGEKFRESIKTRGLRETSEAHKLALMLGTDAG